MTESVEDSSRDNESDEGSDIALIEVEVDDGLVFSATSVPQTFIWDTSEYDNGQFAITFRLTDNAGNEVEQTISYNADNPEGFIDETTETAKVMLENYGVFIGAGGMVLLWVVVKTMLWRRGKKKAPSS